LRKPRVKLRIATCDIKETTMARTLAEFCKTSTAVLKTADPLDRKLGQIAARLAELLANPDFVAEAFSESDPPGHRTLFHCPETDYHVLAHVQRAGKGGMPHSHGASWAIYGNARGFTDMTEWRRVNPAGEEQAMLEEAAKYRLNAGETYAYGPHVIHSTAHPEKAWVIRVTGTDLDHLPRFRFQPQRDKIVTHA
jgi:predicted metal-dependent enzyme (double-stranded beta helix superfamily)